jgi:hypothetical protein
MTGELFRWAKLPAMRVRCVLGVFLATGCGHSPGESDYALRFLGDWQCADGFREIECGQGVVTADLALGPAITIRFERGTATNLRLHLPSRELVSGLPGGPNCVLPFKALGEQASLSAQSTCLDDDGQNVTVHQGTAESWPPYPVILTTEATTSQSCRVTTEARCLGAP